MSRFLALDWDHQQLHVVGANVGKGNVKLQTVALWNEERVPNLGEAEALGQLLREKLRAAGIAPAPVLACVGRDRVILKEIRFPAVPPHEEPAIVRFQVVKELTDAPDEVVIDYVTTGTAPGGEKKALVLIVRKELLNAYQALCKAAGLKFAGLTPRSFGITRCLKQRLGSSMVTPPPEPADGAVAILVVGERWAEFCVSRGDTLVFTRSLNVGPTLAAEVRRNLAVYAGSAPQQPLRAIYVAGGSEHAPFREKLQDASGIPVHAFDPVAGADKLDVPEGSRGSFAGAVGLLLARSDAAALPINFAEPKQPKPPADPNRQKMLVGALVAALVLAFLGLWAYADISRLNRRLDEEHARGTRLEDEVRLLTPEATRADAVLDWNAGAVNYLDELYETAAVFPDYENLRITTWSGNPVAQLATTAKDKDKEKNAYVAKITIKGWITNDKKTEVDKLRADLGNQSPYRPDPFPQVQPMNRQRRQEFSLSWDARKRTPDKYETKLEVPKPTRRAPAFGGPGGADFGGFGGGFQP